MPEPDMAGKTLALLLVGWLAAAAAMAEPFSEKQSGHQVAMEGNSRGATGCVACHGEAGAGLAEAGYPRLAGLPEPYLMGQLQAFREGTRQSTVMQRIAAALNEKEMELVTAYYAGLEVPDTSQPLQDDDLKNLGARLVYVGKWEKGMPACVRCHGHDAQGVPPFFPRLAGQHAGYLEKELHRWQDGERHSDPAGLMQAVADSLDDREITAVAAYLAGIAPAGQEAAGAERAVRAVDADGKEASGGLLPDWLESANEGFSQPAENRIPDDAFGKLVLQGKRAFTETQVYAKQYTGNGLNCVNCHLDRGRRVESAPMGAAYIKYPRYRSKNAMVNTIEERIQGCFTYSENGTPPAPLSDVMKGMVSYFYFLSSGLPSGSNLDVSGFPEIDKPSQAPDPRRGALVFAENCVFCHGANGEGTLLGERYQFPPLWGRDSFNWGAGMHRINTAAAFIHGNMPLGHPGALTLQQAWDAAAYINSHERP
ncbi:MAG: c-type cytochrome, partial [Gammaproteobacteria bacterium]